MKINRNYITKVNFTDRNDLSRIKYIVIHYFGSLSNAKSLGMYWQNSFVGASAHYGIDYNGDIYQYVNDEDIAWHCGADKYVHPECRNSNSIGIEMAVRKRNVKTLYATDKDWYFEDETVDSCVALVKMLMKKYNIPADHVIRHYDVTGKICPNPFVYDTGSVSWAQFKQRISIVDSEIQNQEKTEESISGNAAFIWKMFDILNTTDIVKAAFLGNLDAESGLRSNNVQDSFAKLFDDQTYTDAVDKGQYGRQRFIEDKVGYGLAQWTFWSRKEALYDYVVGRLSRSIGDLEAQVCFLIDELNTNFKLLMLQLNKCKTVREASDLILKKYEAPADQSERVKAKRASLGMDYYNRFALKHDETNPVYLVRVTIPDLRIRTGPGTNYAPVKNSGKEVYTGNGVFTIVDEKMGAGSDAGWGLLKSYSEKENGWISLDFAKRAV